MEGGFAGAVRAPSRIWIDGGVARNIHDDRAASFAGRGRERPQQRLGQAERTDQVGGERAFQVFAIRIAEESERHRAEVGGIVDQDIQAAELARDLHGDRIDVVLRRDVADDAVRAGMSGGDAIDAFAVRATNATRAPRARNSSSRARPRPAVPPVTATRAPANGFDESRLSIGSSEFLVVQWRRFDTIPDYKLK